MRKKLSKSNYFKSIAWSILILLILFYVNIFSLGVVPQQAQFTNGETQTAWRIRIAPQSGVHSIAKQLQAQGIGVNPWFFQLAARGLWVAGKLKPGTYLFPQGASTGQVLLQMARGDRVRETLSIIPGMTIWQLRAAIDANPALEHQTQGLNNQALLKKLNLNYPSAEGLFYPDKYVFDPGESDIAIYQQAASAMQKQVQLAWQQRNPQIAAPNPYTLLILASIVEKETGQAADRGLVAAVFDNRLKKGMLLQTDPTVIYGIGPQFDGNLRKSDLRRDNPYNTYMRPGLPPTPIAMPSRESLFAAAGPVKSTALYFVAKGDGSSYFSTSLPEHERAVTQYQRLPAKAPNSSPVKP